MLTSFSCRLMISVVALALAGDLCRAEEPNRSAPAQTELKKTAEAVYRSAIANYRSGNAAGLQQIETINAWSERIFLAEARLRISAGATRVDYVKKSLQRHIARAKTLEKLTAQMVKAGQAPVHALTAARYHRLVAERRLAMPSARPERLSIELPKASEAVPLTDNPKPLRIFIREESMLINGKPMEPTAIETSLKQFVAAHKNGSVQIRAERGAQIVDVAAVLIMCEKLRRSCSVSVANER